MSDDLLGFQPPTPAAAAGPQRIEDAHGRPVGRRFAFVGVGQAGGRIASCFHSLGYRRVAAINTAAADLRELESVLPAESRLCLGGSGAGGDIHVAERLVNTGSEQVLDLLGRTWGEGVEYGFVCLSAGGGTGAGAAAKVVELARRQMLSTNARPRVGVIVALPKDSDGPGAAANAVRSMRGLLDLRVSPIIIIDNQRYAALYGRQTPASREKPESNARTARVLHAFNTLSATTSSELAGTTFDPADFSRLLDSGLVAFAAVTIPGWATADAFSSPLRDQLATSMLAEIDLSTGAIGGLIYVLGDKAWDEVTLEHTERGVQMVQALLRPDAQLLQGMYHQDGGDGATAVAMVGGLDFPRQRLSQLAKALPKAAPERDWLGV